MTTTTVPGPGGSAPVTVSIAAGISYAYSALVTAVDLIVSSYEATHSGTPSIVVYTPAGLTAATGGHHPEAPLPNTIYLENFQPASGGTYFMMDKASGVLLSGTNGAEIYGRTGASELLAGNDGNDTIRGHGGTGAIISGSGNNHIHSGHGNVMITAGIGNDTIHTGMGSDTINTYGNATVFAGSGNDLYHDFGASGTVIVGVGNSTLFAGAGSDHFTGGTGLTLMYSGTGNDTFTAGSGLTYMNDIGTGNTDFDFNSTYHGSSIVHGFSSSTDTISLEGYTMAQLLGDTTVSGGNSFVNLGDGTKIVFVGVDITKLPTTSFT